MSTQTTSTSAAPMAIMGSYNATSTADVSAASALLALLGLELNKDDSQTLGAQIKTMAAAGQTGAADAKKELRMQSLGTACQAAGQFLSAGASGLGAAASYGMTYGESKRQGALQEQLGETKNLQNELNKRATTNPNIEEIGTEGENSAPISKETQDRIDQLKRGEYSNASALENKGISQDTYNEMNSKQKNGLAPIADDINSDAISHLTPGEDSDYGTIKGQVDNKVKNLTLEINTISSGIQSTQNLSNMIGQGFKEVSSALGATGQSVTQAIQANYTADKQLMGVVGQLEGEQAGVLGKVIDSANQSIDSALSMQAQAAQITASAG